MLRIDNTRRSIAASCLRKDYWQNERNLRSSYGSTALRYGIVWHEAMDSFYSWIAKHGWKRDGKAFDAAIRTAQEEWEYQTSLFTYYDDYRTLPNLLQSIMRYASHFSSDEGMLEVIESEGAFQLQLTEDITFTGIIDLKVKLSGMTWILDHKTTGQNLQEQANRLNRSAQFMGYWYASRELDNDPPTGFLVAFHQISAYKRKDGTYGEPRIDFHRSPQIYTEDDLGNWKESIIHTAKQIAECQATGLWPMQLDSCYNYGRCTYCNLCEQNRPLGEENTYGYVEVDKWDPLTEKGRKKENRKRIFKELGD